MTIYFSSEIKDNRSYKMLREKTSQLRILSPVKISLTIKDEMKKLSDEGNRIHQQQTCSKRNAKSTSDEVLGKINKTVPVQR